jgi:hypothetical protein
VPCGAVIDSETPRLTEYAGAVDVLLDRVCRTSFVAGGGYDQLDVVELVGVVDRRP